MINKVVIIIIVVLFIAFFYANTVEPALLQTRKQPVYIKDLPASLKGFRIVHISDLHGRPFPDKGLVKRINSLNPDIVVITGDIFDSNKKVNTSYAVDVLDGIKPRYGAYFVLGNNDDYLPKDKVAGELGKLGITMLNNEKIKITVGGEDLWIAGVKSTHSRKFDLAEIFKGAGGIKILLAHSPEVIDKAAEAGIDLVLAGHTHGGQIRLPLIKNYLPHINKRYRKYIAGLYRVKNTQLYVNRGLGVSELPLRFLVWPEITVITLYNSKTKS